MTKTKIDKKNDNDKENEIVVKKTNNNKIVEIVDDAKEVAEKATELVSDAAKIAGNFAGQQLKTAKNIFDNVSKKLEEERSKRNLEKYNPIFLSDIENISKSYPSMINIVDLDKRVEVEECKGAIGYQRTIKGTLVLDIYKNEVEKFPRLAFYPDSKPSSSVYYVHPADNNLYIEITEYFKLLKEQRIAELENIAQSLGAKHFKVEIMEETMTKQENKTESSAKFGIPKNKFGINVDKDELEKQYQFLGIAAENTYPGKDPEEPELKLWANNESIKSLVKQRLSDDNPLQSKSFRLDYNTSSGIKEKEAAKIDGILKVLKFGAAGKIKSEAINESKKRLKYTIEF